jgi:hypothetical protein
VNLTWQAVTDVNLTWQAVTDVNLTWQAVTDVPQLNGLRVQRGKNLTPMKWLSGFIGQAG